MKLRDPSDCSSTRFQRRAFSSHYYTWAYIATCVWGAWLECHCYLLLITSTEPPLGTARHNCLINTAGKSWLGFTLGSSISKLNSEVMLYCGWDVLGTVSGRHVCIAGCIARLHCCVKVGHSALKLEYQESTERWSLNWKARRSLVIKQNTSRDSSHSIRYLHPMDLMGVKMMVHTSDRSNLKTGVLGKLSLNASAWVLGFHLFVTTGFHFPSKLH